MYLMDWNFQKKERTERFDYNSLTEEQRAMLSRLDAKSNTVNDGSI